jgi:hypothetical protein
MIARQSLLKHVPACCTAQYEQQICHILSLHDFS